MAIVRENYYEEDGRIFVRTYSDRGMVIEQVGTGFRFAEAIDHHDLYSERTYIETNDPVELTEQEQQEADDSGYSGEELVQAALILLGEVEG